MNSSLDNITGHVEILSIEANQVGNKQMSLTQTATSDEVHVPQLNIILMPFTRLNSQVFTSNRDRIPPLADVPTTMTFSNMLWISYSRK